jgi:arabinofuranosyltransferase
VTMSLASHRLLDPADPATTDELAVVIHPAGGQPQQVRGVGRARTLWLPAGTVLLLALPPMWDWATGGLETGLTLAWVGLLALGLAHVAERPDRPPWWALVVAGLGPLVRPDCAVPALVVLGVILWRSLRASGWRPTLGRLAVAAAIPVAYQVFRMAYFAELVPNTALAKQAGFAHWREGWAYLRDFVHPYGLTLPLAVLAGAAIVVTLGLPVGRRLTVAVLPTAGVVHALVIMRAGGDYAHARLLLPPLFEIVAPFALLPVARRASLPVLDRDAVAMLRDSAAEGGRPGAIRVTGPAQKVSTWVVTLGAVVVITVWGVVAAAHLRKDDPTISGHTLVADGRQAIVGGLGVRNPVTAEQQGWGSNSAPARRIRNARITIGNQRIRLRPRPGLRTPAVVISGVGVSGYSVGTDVYVFDQLGLGDALDSHFRLDRPGFVGHEKPQPAAWLAARLTNERVDDPDAVGGAHPGLFTTPLYVSPPGKFERDVDAARAALQCPGIRRLLDATSRPLTVGRALSNLWHATSYTRFDIDPDPSKARRDLC